MQAYINSIKCLGVTFKTVCMCLTVFNDLCYDCCLLDEQNTILDIKANCA